MRFIERGYAYPATGNLSSYKVYVIIVAVRVSSHKLYEISHGYAHGKHPNDQ